MAIFRIDDTVPLYTNYFHAISQSDTTTDIFKDNAGSVEITFRPNYRHYDIVDKLIKPLKNASVLRPDGTQLLVPLEGSLVLPDTPSATKFPLLIIAHGNHAAYFGVKDTKPSPPTEGDKEFTILPTQVLSYRGYETFQENLATKGIASYSINLNIVNSLENNELGFKKQCLDTNQRILLFFLHLKLLKMLAGETISLPASDDFPIKFRQGAAFADLKNALQNPATDPNLLAIKNALTGKIDFTKLGLMGHSRGADTVSRIPAYFFKGATLPDPSFPTNSIVNTRIKALSEQVGKPLQDSIKSILALEPTSTVNEDNAANHGYIIDNPQTMYFVGVGTHDEDVSLDVVRIYEHPQCSKAMIAINGASHKRFNTVWAQHEKVNDFGESVLPKNLISLADHGNILNDVFGRCFTSTLAGNSRDLLFFSKAASFPVALPRAFDFQSAWKFGFPLQTAAGTLNNLDTIISGIQTENLGSQSFSFEQRLSAFYVEKINEGNFIVKIPIDQTGPGNLSNFTHFSFRFAKGYGLSSNPERIEQKNFTIQLFEGSTPVGKSIQGSDIKTIVLKALRALDERKTTDQKQEFKYSILLQTVEILLSDHFSNTELNRASRIEINVIPDSTKSPPRSAATVVFGSLGGAALSGLIGVGGAAIFNANTDNDDDTDRKVLIGSGIACAALGGYITYRIIRSERNAFVFKDFLLTNRNIP